jgi:hypothetical protein
MGVFPLLKGYFPERSFVWLVFCNSAWWGKIPEADSGGQAAPVPGLHRRRCRVSAGHESEGRHLVLLVADAQREVVQGAANDGVGAVIQRLERRYVAVLPHEHCQCTGKVIGQLQRWLAGGGGVVYSRKMFGSTQCLRKLLKEKKFVKVILGNLKIGQVK